MNDTSETVTQARAEDWPAPTAVEPDVWWSNAGYDSLMWSEGGSPINWRSEEVGDAA